MASISDQIESLRINNSIEYADQAFDAASRGDYNRSIELSSMAIKLFNNDWRYYYNRCYSYHEMKLYTKALSDANVAIHLLNLSKESSPKPYYRKGLALFELKNFLEAERSFHRVIQLDPSDEVAKEYQKECRKAFLTMAGVPQSDIEMISNSDEAFDKYSVQSTDGRKGKTLSTNGATPNGDVTTGVSLVTIDSDDSDNGCRESNGPKCMNGSYGGVLDEVVQRAPHLISTDVKRVPTNVFGFKSVLAANVSLKVTKDQIYRTFGSYGRITGLGKVKSCCDNESQTVIVHYDDPVAAAEAIGTLRDRIFDLPSSDRITADPMKPLLMRFSLGRDQKSSLKMSLIDANQLCDSRGECFAWRSPAGCDEGSDCGYTHHRINYKIDTNQFITDAPVDATDE